MSSDTLLLALCVDLLAGVGATAASPGPLVVYVSTSGSDEWSGLLPEPSRDGTDGPFATLARARDAIRSARTGGATVIVRGGTYEGLGLTAEDCGTCSSPMVYEAHRGEDVRLTGGRVVPGEAFAPITDRAALKRLPECARAHVVWVDLHKQGFDSIPEFPSTYRGAPEVPELFYNDRRMVLARWPNEGWATIAKIVESGSRPRDGDMSNRPGVFEYDGDRPGAWDVGAGVWLQGYWCYDWYDETIRVRSIDPATKRITLSGAALYSVMAGNPSPRRYRALNVLEELDQPGEYYLDCAGGRLFFWPPSDLTGARIVLSSRTEPVVSLAEASHVRLRGFTVEATLGDGIVVSGGTDCRIQACCVRNTRQMGVRVEGGTSHRVEGCDIYDTGTGGLVLSGGDRRALTPAGHEALNNHIHDFSRLQFTGAYAIILGGVGNRAAHNLIHDAPHQAVLVNGNDHVFEYNIVRDVCTETDDCGAYYKGRNPSCRGNIVRYNLWRDIGSPMGHGNAAVYFDDGDGGDTVFGNVFYRCGEPGRGPFGTVFSHGGHGIAADNNVFIECKRALGSAPWDDARWLDALRGGQDCFFTQKLFEEVDITRPPYTTHYPELIGFMDPQPGEPRVSHAARNVMINCGEVSCGNWVLAPAGNLVLDRDPGFEDAVGGDLRLRARSEVYRRLPGFAPIPVSKIGLYADALRPGPPAELWPSVSLRRR